MAIIEGLGYKVVAQARRRPVWVGGRVVSNDGSIDLADGSIDFIAIAGGKPTLFVQVTTVNGLSERRRKLRDALHLFDPPLHMPVLMGWDDERKAFRVFRREANFLDEGHAIVKGARVWPWEEERRQQSL